MTRHSLILFPTAASLVNNTWHIPIHGCLFRPAEVSHLRRYAMRWVKRLTHLRFPSADLSTPNFQKRAAAFLADNIRGTRLIIECCHTSVTVKPTRPNGHFYDVLKIPNALTTQLCTTPHAWIPFSAPNPLNPLAVSAAGRALLLPPTGLSVISDIDDTIKITDVLNRKQMLNHTFLQDFITVPQMAALYQRWHTARNAAFHYVSASPWHLYPFLQEFLSAQNFPPGTFHLRDFRLAPRDLLQTIRPAPLVKKKHIRALLKQFPHRQFILVGDSGESDAPLYASLYRSHPAQIKKIYIRNITAAPPESPRWKKQFAGVPPRHWQVFSSAAEITD